MMATVPTDERVQLLIREAKAKSDVIRINRFHDLTGSLSRVETILNTPIDRQSQIVLLLSAALQHMKSAERMVVSLIIGDEPFNIEDMGILVRIRLICSEVIGLLITAQQETQLAHVYIH